MGMVERGKGANCIAKEKQKVFFVADLGQVISALQGFAWGDLRLVRSRESL